MNSNLLLSVFLQTLQKSDSFRSSQKTFDDQGGSIPAQQHKGFNLNCSGFTSRLEAGADSIPQLPNCGVLTSRITKPLVLEPGGPFGE